MHAAVLRRGLAVVTGDASHRIRRPYAALFLSTTPLSAGVTAVAGTGSPQFIADYLVASPCTFSVAEAAKVAERIAHLKSTAKPQAVLRFLESRGFDAANVRKLVTWNPNLLCRNSEKTIAPKFDFLLKMGFNDAEIVGLVMTNPAVLTHGLRRSIMPKIEFWTKLLGSREDIVTLSKRNQWFLGYNIKKTIIPNVSLLHECGIADDQISFLLRKHPRFIAQSSDSLRALIKQVEEFGLPRSSRMFIWALDVLFRNSKVNLEAKMKHMINFWWSESEFFAAFARTPQFLSLSVIDLQRKMEFITNVLGYEKSYVAKRPILLTFSLKNRLIPRYRVIELLKSKGILETNSKLLHVASMTDKKFMDKYVSPYMEKFPEIHGSFVSR